MIVVLLLLTISGMKADKCEGRVTFARWSGVTPERASPVFVYAASGDEESLAGACLARCRDLPDCGAVVVAYGRGNCYGTAIADVAELKQDNDSAYFKKICLEQPEDCGDRWWSTESTPGHSLHTNRDNVKAVRNATLRECYAAVLNDTGQTYRSAQWVNPGAPRGSETMRVTDVDVGSCMLSSEDKFSEPESYRVSNYHTVYIENQCRHDYLKKIDRCSYEEYYNQTLRHVELTRKNITRDECKEMCELERRFVCRGFTWTERGPHPGPGHGADQDPALILSQGPGPDSGRGPVRGLCDLHSEDLVSTGSWLLRRVAPATYYRRVTCLNMSAECSGGSLVVTYHPRGSFSGRVYVPGRGERCGARGAGGAVRLALPLYGDCGVNFAYALTKTPTGTVNRTMAYVMVMIQHNPIIQTAGDRWVRVGCSPGNGSPTHAVDATVTVKDASKPSQASEFSTPAAASAVFGSSGNALSMYVVRADYERDLDHSVSLGEPLELRVETTDSNEILAYHLVASSRLGDSSVLLLDSRGCPTGQVDFPPFSRSWLGGTQRLSARFKAFRFPTSHVVRFSLMIRTCDRQCAPTECSQQGRSARDAEDSPSWAGVLATGGVTVTDCSGGGGGGSGGAPLELELSVGAADVLSGATTLRAQPLAPTEGAGAGEALVCIHESVGVALVLAALAVQLLLLAVGVAIIKRYRNLAEMSMQKEYQSFDNVGFDNVSTHRRVHWPDQGLDALHT